MTTTDFICALVITNRCMGYLRGLTYSLQAEAKDVVEAVADVDSVVNALDDVRKNVESYHKDWYEEAGKMCTSVGVEPSLPRLCGRQKHRHNVPAEDPATCYRRCITIPMIDHFLTDMKSRFSPHHRVALLGLSLVPSALVSLSADNIKANVAGLVAQYQHDLRSPRSVATQVHSWKLKWEEKAKQHGKACLPTSPSEALPHATSLFPDIQILLQILCTLPVTSCTNERSHSSLKRIKTYLRSTCSNERLSALALMLIHRDVPVDPLTMVEEFARRQPRRMQLTTFKWSGTSCHQSHACFK